MALRGLGEGREPFGGEKRADMHRDDEATLPLPKFDYHIDESDPDVLVLRRQDGSLVVAFSACGATREGIVEAAKEDYAALLREHAGLLGLASRRQKVGVPEDPHPTSGVGGSRKSGAVVGPVACFVRVAKPVGCLA
jgi:hypothetical protein